MDRGLNRRSLKADAGLLFLACWVMIIVSYLVKGRLAVVEALGGGLVVFFVAVLILIGRRHQPDRLSTSLWGAGIFTALITWGSLVT